MENLSNQELLDSDQHQMGIRTQIFSEYQNNAQKRNINFNLTFNVFNQFIINKCYYCGSEPINISERWIKRMNKSQPILQINGIDRINSLIGYTIDNCVTCCSKCNLMKNVFSVEEFLTHVSKIHNYNKKGSTTIPKGSTLKRAEMGRASKEVVI